MMLTSLCLCLKIDVQMVNLVLHLLHWFCKKYKNQRIKICKHAYDDVQPSEWSRWRSSCCMHFCYYTVFTHSLYCPLRVIKLKYILDTCSIYRFCIWTMDLTYKKLIYSWHYCLYGKPRWRLCNNVSPCTSKSRAR